MIKTPIDALQDQMDDMADMTAMHIMPSHPLMRWLCRIGIHKWSDWFEPVGVDFERRNCLRCWKRDTRDRISGAISARSSEE